MLGHLQARRLDISDFQFYLRYAHHKPGVSLGHYILTFNSILDMPLRGDYVDGLVLANPAFNSILDMP